VRYRRLGREGPQVSEVGYGAWGIGGSGWVGADEQESVRALQRAIDLGVNFIDTARGYGESERLVGEVVVASCRDVRVYVATKVPPANGLVPAPTGLHPNGAFSRDHVRRCLATSLEQLGLPAVDLLQFHAWQDEWLGRGQWEEAIEELKAEGVVRWFGVSVNDHQPASATKLVQSGLVDAVQVIYNVFDQSPEDELLPLCQQHGVGVIVRVALDEGGLTGRIRPDTTFPEGDCRRRYFRGDRRAEVARRVAAIRADLGLAQDEIAAIALRFVLSHPAVTCVIPGMRSVRNVQRNVAVSDAGPLDRDTLTVLRRHRWVRNYYQD
jgi:aryl-alcohol dehydrogenase-like predicted oxidoreductase